MSNSSHTVERSVPFVGCTFCVYEIPAGKGPCPIVQRATLSVRTPRGVRQLCDAHAAPFEAAVP